MAFASIGCDGSVRSMLGGNNAPHGKAGGKPLRGSFEFGSTATGIGTDNRSSIQHTNINSENWVNHEHVYDFTINQYIV